MPTKVELQTKCEQLERDNAELVRQLHRMERHLSGQLLPEERQPADMPTNLMALMKKHRVPWEIFWCYEHERWLDELCSSFPHDTYGTCPGCRGEDGQNRD
ncbi:antitoxin PHD (plasmid) [Citrobacter freundii]|uniref:antitoxin PHD n=1 Tax=Citrobacter freundii TaxID=546 RepID=UPI0015E91AAA|nr:antitoxin PHD [Citrobacter freundii]QLV95590.1 antitoxin PHD [Citrobacter freundii]